MTIGNNKFRTLSHYLNKRNIFQHLDISHNNLHTRSGVAINELLTKTQIKHLNLSWNELYMPDCVEKICQGIKASVHIKELNYMWNGLSGTDWVKSFKQAVVKNETLEVLRLENNR